MKIKGTEIRFNKKLRQALWEPIKILLDSVWNFLFGVGAVYLAFRLAAWVHHLVTRSEWLARMAAQNDIPSNWSAVGFITMCLVIPIVGAMVAILALELVWLFGAWLRGKVFDGILKFRRRIKRKLEKDGRRI